MGIIGNLASAIGGDKNNNIAECSLTEIKNDGTITGNKTIKFQYFPETISDSRGVDLSAKDVTGGSHPIYQWTHGSDRRVSFEAVFTADIAPNSHDTENVLEDAKVITGAIKNPAASLGAAIGSFSKQTNQFQADIRAYLAWLRAKTYPLYKGTSAVTPPPILLLYIQNSGITSYVHPAWPRDVLTCVMTSCVITYDAFFRNGVPRIATVSLEFTEVIQVGLNWKFVNRANIDAYWNSKYLFDGKPPTSSATSNLASAVTDAVNSFIA